MPQACLPGELTVPDTANPGQFLCLRPPRNDPACAPPLVPAVNGIIITCVAPPTCKVFFEYVTVDPTIASTPTLEMQPGCDQAGLEIALVAALAAVMKR